MTNKSQRHIFTKLTSKKTTDDGCFDALVTLTQKLHREFVQEEKAGKINMIKDFHCMMPDFIGHAI